MKRSYSLLALWLTISLWSCKEDHHSDADYTFFFFPRKVETLWSDNLCFVPAVEDKDGNMTYFVDEYFNGTSSKAELYLLGLYTCNLAYDTAQIKNYFPDYEFEYVGNWPVVHSTHYKPLSLLQSYKIITLFIDEGNDFIEKRLKDDYNKYMNKFYPSFSEWAPLPIWQEYRITEIVNLTISCDQTLFGKTAGSSLNDHFHIYDLDPACIFAGNDQLRVTHEAMLEKTRKGFTIDEWLSYRPLSAACYYFKFNNLPAELPVSKLRFNISVETVDGEKISCTGKEITLTL